MRKRLFENFKEQQITYQEFLDYKQFKTALPALHSVKQNNIHHYREKYDFTILIESGTYLGDMVAAQLAYFDQIFSIELSKELYGNALERFNENPNVKILHGDSGTVLQTLVNELSAPALFWLDGHYSAGITAKGNKNTPIFEELEAILKSPIHHGILIDDARLFVGKDDYPSIDELCFFIKEKNPSFMVSVSDDIIQIFRR